MSMVPAGSQSARPRKRARTSGKPTKSIVARVKRLEAAVEKKSKEFVVNSTTSHVSIGSVTMLNQLTLGDDIDQREGRRIMITSTSMKYHTLTAQIAANNMVDLRTAIVWDKYPNQGVAGYGEIFELTTLAEGENPLAPLNLANRDRFVLLYDNVNYVKHGKIDRYGIAPAGSVLAQEIGADNMFVKINRTSTYGEGSDIPVTGGLLLVTCGSSNTDAGGPSSNFKAYNRFRFTDS